MPFHLLPSRCREDPAARTGAIRAAHCGVGVLTAVCAHAHTARRPASSRAAGRAAARVPAPPVRPLACRLKRDQRGWLYADIHLTDGMSGGLLTAKTARGKVYATWRLDAPPGYVATQYPVKIIVNAPASLRVLLHVDFGPAGFQGFGVERNGRRAEFQPSVIGHDNTMWLPGGRSVIEYGAF